MMKKVFPIFFLFILCNCQLSDFYGEYHSGEKKGLRIHAPSTFKLFINLFENDSLYLSICCQNAYLPSTSFDTAYYYASRQITFVQEGNNEYSISNCDDPTHILMDVNKHIKFSLNDSLKNVKEFDIDIKPILNQISKKDSTFFFTFTPEFFSFEAYSYDSQIDSSIFFNNEKIKIKENCYEKSLLRIVALDTIQDKYCDCGEFCQKLPSYLGYFYEEQHALSYFESLLHECPLLTANRQVKYSWESPISCYHISLAESSDYSISSKILINPQRKLEEISKSTAYLHSLKVSNFIWEITTLYENQSSHKTDSIFIKMRYLPVEMEIKKIDR